jgi:hypothetical protein
MPHFRFERRPLALEPRKRVSLRCECIGIRFVFDASNRQPEVGNGVPFRGQKLDVIVREKRLVDAGIIRGWRAFEAPRL